jgi:hypothetical protein
MVCIKFVRVAFNFLVLKKSLANEALSIETQPILDESPKLRLNERRLFMHSCSWIASSHEMKEKSSA